MLLERSYGLEETVRLCKIQNTRAPLTVRANTLRTSQEDLLWTLKKEGFDVKPTPYAPNGVRFLSHPERSIQRLKSFERGEFEVQDEASQLVGQRVDARPGQLVVDYCGGSGGKALAFGPFLHNTGQIFIHDVRKGILLQARQRIRRAGLQNVQFHLDKAKLHRVVGGKADWVLVDAPCSGTGTLRRNPEMKWKFSMETLLAQLQIQKRILEEALTLVGPKGRLVYSTCSLLREENMEQVARLAREHDLELEGGVHFQSVPERGGMDGLFAATLKRKK